MLQNANEESKANGGPEFSDLDSWSQSVKENEYAKWHDEKTNSDKLGTFAATPTYTRAKELFNQSQQEKPQNENGKQHASGENAG